MIDSLEYLKDHIENANIKSFELDIDFNNPDADDDINQLIKNLSTSSAAGPSGIDGNYIKSMYPGNLTSFKRLLRFALSAIMENPILIASILELFQYRSIFLPKDDNNHFRHIAIQETLLTGFHKILLVKLQSIYGDLINSNQYAMQKFANVKCIKSARLYNNEGVLIKIDIQKAFDCIPFQQIINTLNDIEMPANLIQYIAIFIQTRYSDLMGYALKGVPQGDPLSMFIFCLDINPILERLEQESQNFSSYADDLIIQVKDENRSYGEIGLAAKKFWEK